MSGQLTFNRMSLSPYKGADRDNLQKLTGNRMVFPLDEELGISVLPYKLTVYVMLEIAYWVQQTFSYETAKQAIARNTPITVNVETIRSVANTVGSIVFNNDVAKARNIEQLYNQTQLVFPKEKINYDLYLEVDGAMLHTRDKETGTSPWKENKLGLVFSSDNISYYTDSKGERQHRLGKREYTSYLGDVAGFKKHMFALAYRNGYGRYKHTILLSDGATWIRNMKEELFPDAQQILDYFHLCENITNYAKDIFSLDEDKYKSWANDCCLLFKKSKTNEAIQKIKSTDTTKKKNKFDLLNYINNNITNIDYDTYINRGWFIGSGAIESANRSVLQQRLKQPGMRWNSSSGQFILSLMSKAKSGLWDKDVVEAVKHHYQKNAGQIC